MKGLNNSVRGRDGATDEVVFIVVLNHVIACGWFLTGKFAVDTGGTQKGNKIRIVELGVHHHFSGICWEFVLRVDGQTKTTM